MKSTSVLSHPPSPRQILSFPVSADEPVRQKLRCLKHALPHRKDEISALVYECVFVFEHVGEGERGLERFVEKEEKKTLFALCCKTCDSEYPAR